MNDFQTHAQMCAKIREKRYSLDLNAMALAIAEEFNVSLFYAHQVIVACAMEDAWAVYLESKQA